jgi:hypothetical protein
MNGWCGLAQLLHWPQFRSHVKHELKDRSNEEARLFELIAGLEQLVIQLDCDAVASEILFRRVGAGKEAGAIRLIQRRLDNRSAAAVQLLSQA